MHRSRSNTLVHVLGYWLTLNNLQQGGAIRYNDERKETMRGESVEWQVFVHSKSGACSLAVGKTYIYISLGSPVNDLDLSRFPASGDMIGRSYWEYGARVREAKELVARNILLSLNIPEQDILDA